MTDVGGTRGTVENLNGWSEGGVLRKRQRVRKMDFPFSNEKSLR